MSFPFANQLKQTVISQFNASALGVVNPYATARQALCSARDELSKSNVKLDNLILSLTESVECISENDVIGPEPYDGPYEVIPLDVFNDIKATLDELAGDSGKFVITLNNGRIIQFTVLSSTIVPPYGFYCTEDISGTTTPIQRWFITNTGSECRLNQSVVTVDGHIIPLYKVLKQLVSSSQINDAIIDVCDVIDTNEAKTSLPAKLNDLMRSSNSQVVEFANSVLKAFTLSGNIGVANYIINFFRKFSKLYGEGDTLQFTDDSTYIPQDFMVGIIQIAYTVIAVLATAIIAIFSRTLAIAAGALFTVGAQIMKVYDSEKQKEYARIVTDQDVIPFSGYPVYQIIGVREGYTIPNTSPDYGKPIVGISSNHVIYIGTYNSGKSFGYYKTYGGYVMYGPRQYNEDGEVVLWTIEFHPDLVDRRDRAAAIWSKLNSQDSVITISQVNSEGNSFYSCNLQFEITTLDREGIQSILEASASSDSIFPSVQNDIDGEYSGYVKSEEMRLFEIISANCFLFWMSNNNHNYPTLFLEFTMNNLEGTAARLATAIMADDRISSANLVLMYLDERDVGSFVTEIPFSYQGLNHVLRIGSASSNYSSNPYLNLGVGVDKYNDLPGIKPETGYGHIFNWGISRIDNSVIIQDQSDFNLPQSGNYPILSNKPFLLETPKYSRGSVLAGIIASAVILAIAATVVITTSIVVKRKLSSIRAISAAKVAQAWDTFESDPTSENYAAYRKAAKKNNRMASLIGGTKYDVDNYWFPSDNNSETSSVSTKIDTTDILYIIKGRS